MSENVEGDGAWQLVSQKQKAQECPHVLRHLITHPSHQHIIVTDVSAALPRCTLHRLSSRRPDATVIILPPASSFPIAAARQFFFVDQYFRHLHHSHIPSFDNKAEELTIVPFQGFADFSQSRARSSLARDARRLVRSNTTDPSNPQLHTVISHSSNGCGLSHVIRDSPILQSNHSVGPGSLMRCASARELVEGNAGGMLVDARLGVHSS